MGAAGGGTGASSGGDGGGLRTVEAYLLELAGPYEPDDPPSRRERRVAGVKMYESIDEI